MCTTVVQNRTKFGIEGNIKAEIIKFDIDLTVAACG